MSRLDFTRAWRELAVGDQFYLLPEGTQPKPTDSLFTKGSFCEAYLTARNHEWYPMAIYCTDHQIVAAKSLKQRVADASLIMGLRRGKLTRKDLSTIQNVLDDLLRALVAEGEGA